MTGVQTCALPISAENLAAAQSVFYTMCTESRYVTDYSSAETATRFFAERKADVIATEYSDGVIFTVAVKREEVDGFNRSLINALNGKIKIFKQKEYYFPFRI